MNTSNHKKDNKQSGNKTKLSNTPFVILILLAFILLGYQYFKYQKQLSPFTNPTDNIPYIAQSAYINIYSTPIDYPKFQWFLKGNLFHNILINNGKDAYVMVPKTLVNIPVNVYKNAPKTRFTIMANSIEQEIQECDFIATTF